MAIWGISKNYAGYGASDDVTYVRDVNGPQDAHRIVRALAEMMTADGEAAEEESTDYATYETDDEALLTEALEDAAGDAGMLELLREGHEVWSDLEHHVREAISAGRPYAYRIEWSDDVRPVEYRAEALPSIRIAGEMAGDDTVTASVAGARNSAALTVGASVAKAIAAHWQSPGTNGSVLAALASGAEVVTSDALDDVERTRRWARTRGPGAGYQKSDFDELDALAVFLARNKGIVSDALDRLALADLATADPRNSIRMDASAPAGHTVSGYGDKIPTRYMLRIKGTAGRPARWHRVYVMAYGNAGTPYVMRAGEKVLLSIEVESALENARDTFAAA